MNDNSVAAMNHEADVLGVDLGDPSAIGTDAFITAPQPLKLRPKLQLPDDPALQGFFARLSKTSPFRRAAMTPKTRRYMMMAYAAGWVDRGLHDNPEPEDVMSAVGPREDFSSEADPSVENEVA